ncbi:hypothetical protein SETIT_7G271100v2 [Setaria italica]|uniref:Peroxidase n=1 Tax=Setaria italica TaxID=4555 RepID=K3Y890_SETIT|nr:peroxidase 5 [Setaria italica]RCV35829.1 hypothetical protein SETIT_7G271100v2 [Setaria italica]
MTRKRCYLRFATLLAGLLSAAACLDFGFYDRMCPAAETIVQQTVADAFRNNSGVAPALIRLHFHDCFVRGCDGSVLIDSTTNPNNTAEKDAPPNNPSLRFFDVIDRAKAAVEAQCPGVVSCADILAFAARDSVVLSGGLGYQLPAGRRDGRISRDTDALNDLPPPFFNATQLADSFASKNLTVEDLVVLSGAHTIGVSHCSSFAGVPDNPADRLYNFSSPEKIDPALSKAYAFLLKSICPSNSSQFFPTTTTLMDLITPDKLDNKYYVGLTNNLGLFISDAALLTNATMKALVDSFVRSEATWKAKFARSMLKMGQIGVLTGTQGEIRRNCRVVNPAPRTAAGVHRVVAGSDSSGFTGVAAS